MISKLNCHIQFILLFRVKQSVIYRNLVSRHLVNKHVLIKLYQSSTAKKGLSEIKFMNVFSCCSGNSWRSSIRKMNSCSLSLSRAQWYLYLKDNCVNP